MWNRQSGTLENIYYNSGSVGIGTTNPLTRLQVGPTTNRFTTIGISATTSPYATYIGGNAIIDQSVTPHALLKASTLDTGGSIIAMNHNGTIQMQAFDAGIAAATSTAWSPQFTLLPSGYVGIGTVAPGYPLDVNGKIRAVSVIYTSDSRLKKGIQPIDSALDRILSLDGITYFWNKLAKARGLKDEKKQIGLIAQNVESVFPESVETEADGFKSVNYPSLIAPVIQAIKEFHLEWIRNSHHLERKIEVLEEENIALKKWICKKDKEASFCNETLLTKEK
jgi:hypothetical protein